MKKVVTPAIFAAIVVYVWMFISWAFLPWHKDIFKNLPNGDSLAVQMKSSIKKPGIYRYPGVPAKATTEDINKIAEKYAAGPIISFMIYSPSGMNMANPLQFVWGFIIIFLNALVAAFLLYTSRLKEKRFLIRLTFILLLAVFAALIGPMVEWNWLLFPADYSFGVALDYLVTWLLGGIVLAGLIKGKNKKEPEAA
jgi:hypothetical protein